MIEKIIYLDSVDLSEFCGVNNSKLELIRNRFPKLKIVCRGNWLKAMGDAEEVADFEEKINNLLEYCNQYNVLTEQAIVDITSGDTTSDSAAGGPPLPGVGSCCAHLIPLPEEVRRR